MVGAHGQLLPGLDIQSSFLECWASHQRYGAARTNPNPGPSLLVG